MLALRNSQLQIIRLLDRQLSRKEAGSANRARVRWTLARTHIRIADKRRDFHFELTHALCDVLISEDLNLDGMKRINPGSRS